MHKENPFEKLITVHIYSLIRYNNAVAHTKKSVERLGAWGGKLKEQKRNEKKNSIQKVQRTKQPYASWNSRWMKIYNSFYKRVIDRNLFSWKSICDFFHEKKNSIST